MQYNGQIPHRLASTGVEVATSSVRLPARIAKAEKAIRQAASIFFFMVLSSKNGNGSAGMYGCPQQETIG
jgi:hypothetical protein